VCGGAKKRTRSGGGVEVGVAAGECNGVESRGKAWSETRGFPQTEEGASREVKRSQTRNLSPLYGEAEGKATGLSRRRIEGEAARSMAKKPPFHVAIRGNRAQTAGSPITLLEQPRRTIEN